MSSSSKQNANGKVISLGEEIHGKWSPPRTAHGTVKSFGKTKVKILLTEDFTKTLVKGMCVDIYFQNTWKDGREPPENWKENFKWKTNNPDKKGSRSNKKKVGKSYADYKKDMTLKEEYSPTEIIKIAMEYEKIKSHIPQGIDKYCEELDKAREKKLQEEKEQREKEFKEKQEKEQKKKEFLALLWEQNKEKFNAMFEEKSVQEVMEEVEECDNCEGEDVAQQIQDLLDANKTKKELNAWICEYDEDYKPSNKKNAIAYLQNEIKEIQSTGN